MTMPMSSAVSFMFSFEFTDKNQELSLTTMAIRLVSFQTRGTQLERFLPKNQHTQTKFENWVNKEVSKIPKFDHNLSFKQRFTYRVLQTIQMKLILSYVWAEFRFGQC